MRFNKGAQLDTSQVSDPRGAGPLAVGGGGIGLIILVFTLLNGGDGASRAALRRASGSGAAGSGAAGSGSTAARPVTMPMARAVRWKTGSGTP